jgi:acyl-coenzyme A synthetase/AMP-(fatty) acid ligase
VGLPDAEWGAQVAALVVLKPEATIEAEALLYFARQRLAGYKLPRRIGFAAALPQTASGKIARVAVREMLLAGQDDGTARQSEDSRRS